MNCYIDTLTSYIETNTTPIIDNTNVQWKFIKCSKKEDNHFFINHKNLTCRYYPNRYGISQIWLTFSIPKLLKGNNLYPLSDTKIDICMYKKVNNILAEIFHINTIPTYDISTWEVSRMDLFILHKIKPNMRKWYLKAYEHLALGSYIPYKYKNTFYLNSTLKKHKSAGTVVRIYPKIQEIHDKNNKVLMREVIPRDVENDFEHYMIVNDELVDYIRVEFQFRRQILRYYFNRSKSVTVADVMKESFQVQLINKMIKRLGLHRNIISRNNMKLLINKVFVKQPTRQRASDYIRLVNGRGIYLSTIKKRYTEGQIKYIRGILHKHNIHTVVSEFVDLEPVKLL